MLGSIVTVMWILYRLAEMGIDLGGLNPWLWRRRRHWKKKFEANPLFAIESPMEATAVAVTAVAKADGDMSKEERSKLLRLFETEFSLSQNDASALLNSSTHLLGSGEALRENPAAVLARSIDGFTDEQCRIARSLVQAATTLDGLPSTMQTELANTFGKLLVSRDERKENWGQELR